MTPECDLSAKDAPPGKKLTRESITLEQKMDVLSTYDRGESTAAICNALNLPESTLHTIRKDKKIKAAFKAGTGSASTRVSSGQSTFMVRLEKMLVMWMDHFKCQSLNVIFNDTKKAAMECYHHLNAKETGPVPDFVASTGWFYNLKVRYAFHSIKRFGEAKSADADAAASYPDELRAIIEEGGGTRLSRSSTWKKRSCNGRKCLTACTSQRRRSLPQVSRHLRTVSLSC